MKLRCDGKTVSFNEKHEGDLLSTPQVVGEKLKRLGEITGCKDTTFLWRLMGFRDGSNIGSTVSCWGEIHRYTVHLH